MPELPEVQTVVTTLTPKVLGRRVVAVVSVRDDILRLDFTGTAPAVRGNVNCPRSVTRAAAVFVLRTLDHPLAARLVALAALIALPSVLRFGALRRMSGE